MLHTGYYIDPVMRSNVYGAIFNPTANETWGRPEFVCSTGNCTYPSVANLDVRSLCSNITADLSIDCKSIDGHQNCTVAIENGASLSFKTGNDTYGGSPLVIVALTSEQKPLLYNTRDSLVLEVVQWIYAPGLNATQGASMLEELNPNSRFVATECALEVVARGSNISIRSNKYSELYLNTSNDFVSDTINGKTVYTFRPSWLSDLGYDPSNNFTLGQDAWYAMLSFLTDAFTGYVWGASDNLEFTSGSLGGTSATTAQIGSDVVQALFTQNFCNGNCEYPDDKLTILMRNVALAMSKTFRDAPYSLSTSSGSGGAVSDNLQVAANTTVGTTLRSATFVAIHWKWFSLPALVWLLTAITWLGTMWYTRMLAIPKWRNSILPLLFLYREDQEEEETKTIARTSTDGDSDHQKIAATSGMITDKAFILQAQAIKTKLYVDHQRQKVRLA